MTAAEHVVDPGVNRTTAEPDYARGRREAAEAILAAADSMVDVSDATGRPWPADRPRLMVERDERQAHGMRLAARIAYPGVALPVEPEERTEEPECSGCVAKAAGAARFDYRHRPTCSHFDAFYDATDEQLAGMVPPRPARPTEETTDV